MKKSRKRRRWVWAAGAAVVVAVALALVFREQPPYEFLRGAERVRTTVSVGSARFPPYATTTYVSDLTPDEIGEIAREELEPLGWQCTDRTFHSPRLIVEVWTGEFEPVNGKLAFAERMLGKTYISINRPANVIDRFRAWLDRVTGR